jgi:hypothetical protein
MITVPFSIRIAVAAILTATCFVGEITAQPPAPERKADPPAVPLPFPRMPPFFTTGDPAAQHRTRSIKAVFRGQRVEIQDRGGREIRIVVARKTGDAAARDEFQAADAEALRQQRPDLAALYDRLAGPR